MPLNKIAPNIELLIVEMQSKFCVVLLYRPPNVTELKLRETITYVLEIIPTRSCIVFGDFNKNILQDPEKVQFSALAGFRQLITKPTFYVGSGAGSLLDHIYVKHCEVVSSGLLHTHYSDHDPVYVQVDVDD